MRSAEDEKRRQSFAKAAEEYAEASLAAFEHQRKIAERRDEILKLVQTGQLGPLIADQIVEQERLYPLSTNPSVNSINIFKLPYWTMEMVLAWVIGRHREDVLLFHDPFRTNIVAWKPIFTGDERTGYDLAHEEPATIAAIDLHAGNSIDDDADERSQVAKAKLWGALETGRIKASAYDMLQKSVVTIPDIEWAYLTFSDVEDKPAKLRFKSSNENRYSDIKFRSTDVLTIWPPIGDQKEPRWFSPYPHSIYEIVDQVGPDGRSVFAPPMIVEEPPIDCDSQEVPVATNSNQAEANLVEDTERATQPPGPLFSVDGGNGPLVDGLRLSPMEQDIQEAIQSLWRNGQHPKVQAQLQAAVNDYLKRERHYKKAPDPKTYQRYFKKIRQV